MSETKKMQLFLPDANRMANEIVQQIKPFCERVEIVGSIRRLCPIVHDIDILVQPKTDNPFDVFIQLKSKDMNLRIVKSGNKIVEAFKDNIQVDFYFATKETWDTLLLIRTGSRWHNVTLTSAAKQKGLKLKADGTGLINEKGEILAKTEDDIIQYLLGKKVAPQYRN